MNNYARFLLGLGFILASSHVCAYEETTHEVLTKFAVTQSVLYKDSTLLSDLGVSRSGPYVTTTQVSGDIGTVVALGARIEDHGGTRSLNHFFDPQFNKFQGRPLYVPALGGALGNMSPDWSIEDRGESIHAPFGQILHQDFSYRNGQHNLFRLLTGSTPTNRQAAASALFQTLGHVVHHVQDMAQPQHVRNDQHVHWDAVLNDSKWSFYERYTEQLNESRIPTYICGSSPPNPSQCVTDYPVTAPYFPTARQYWHTPGTQVAKFVGMADFTSQNYVSYGTSYQTAAFGGSVDIQGHPDFPLPSGSNRDGSTKKTVNQTLTVTLVDGTNYRGNMNFLEGSIYDEYLGATIPYQKLAAASFLNSWYLTKGIYRRVFTENSRTYEDTHRILLPRAVAFSTGLINHFFRGRIDLRRAPSGNSWLIENKSQFPLSGAFSVYFENAIGNRQQLQQEFFNSLGVGQNVAINLTIPASDVTKLIAVFRGKIGDEGDQTLSSGYYAVAGIVVPYSSPAIPCGSPLAAGGGAEGLGGSLGVLQELGSVPGPVRVNFEAYTLPDGLEIFANNSSRSRLLTTNGLISGTRSLSFNHDPASTGSTQVRVKVTGNNDIGTAWSVEMSCPNGSAPAPKAVGVLFSSKPNTTGYPTCVGGWRYTINGSTSSSGIRPLSISEQHTYSIVYDPWPPSTSNCVMPQPYYKDSLGEHSMSIGRTVTFTVR